MDIDNSRKMGRSILLNNSNNNTSDDMARLHTYIHTYMHTCTSLPSPVLSASMRDGVVEVGSY